MDVIQVLAGLINQVGSNWPWVMIPACAFLAFTGKFHVDVQ